MHMSIISMSIEREISKKGGNSSDSETRVKFSSGISSRTRIVGFRVIPSCDWSILHSSSTVLYTCTYMVLVLDTCKDLQPGKLLILSKVRIAEAFTLQQSPNGAKCWTRTIGRRLIHPFVGIVFQLSPWTFQKKKKKPRSSLLTGKAPVVNVLFVVTCQHTFFLY